MSENDSAADRDPRVHLVAIWASAGVLFLLAAITLTWPLVTQLDSGLVLGTEAVATVPLFNLWTLAWNAESFTRGYQGYWQAPIFHPANDAFALSEPQPLAGLFAASLTALGGSPLMAYNLILVFGLATNGLLSMLVLRIAGLGWTASASGGALVLVLPFTHQELGVLQLVPLTGVLLAAIAALRFGRRPGWKPGLMMGCALVAAYLLSAQIAVFAVMAAVPALAVGWWPLRRERRAWIGLGVGAALFLALTLPMIVAQSRSTAGESFERSLETVRAQSARPAHYLESAWPMLVPAPGVAEAERPSQRAFWPGTVRIVLALTALAVGWRQKDFRRFVVVLGLVLVTSLILSMAAHLELGGLSLIGVLRALPGVSQIRSFFRFALFAQLATAGLAALALEQLLRWSRERVSARSAAGVVAALALVAVIDVRPTIGEIQALPPLSADLGWLTWVEDNTDPDTALAFLPFPEGRRSRDYLGTAQWMYWQTRHWRPMVNGYSGFFPRRFRELKDAMESFPSQKALLALREAGVDYCVVHRLVIESSPPPDPNGAVQLVQVFRDEENALAVFELLERDHSED